MNRSLARVMIALRRLVRPIVRADLTDLVPLASVFVLLLSAFDEWYMLGPFTMLALAGVVWRPWLKTPSFWYLAAMLFGVACYLNWHSADNHKYLMTYWCLALCVVFSVEERHREAVLAHNARLLLGLCMLLAISWRLSSDNYLSGGFFHFTLLTDERFQYFGQWLGDASPAALADNRQLKELLATGYLRGLDVTSVQLADGGGLRTWATVLTWWTLFIEGSIGLLFAVSACRGLTRCSEPETDTEPTTTDVALAWLRNGLLLLFGTTTYVFAPVRGFGWILMLLGLAQCGDRDRSWRLAFVAVLLLIQSYTMPYGALIEGLRSLFGG